MLPSQLQTIFDNGHFIRKKANTKNILEKDYILRVDQKFVEQCLNFYKILNIERFIASIRSKMSRL